MESVSDLFYPDNENRESRANELANDCATLAFSICNDKSIITGMLIGATEAINNAYKDLAADTIAVSDVELGDDWYVTVAESIAPFIVYGPAAKAFTIIAKSVLLREGRIGEAALIDLLGLPRWFQLGKVVSGLAATVALEAIIEAVDGAIRRDKYRDAIHSLIPPRITLQKNMMINRVVKNSLTEVKIAYEATQHVPGMTKEILDGILKNLLDTHKVNIDSIDDKAAISELAALDGGRKSWTKED